MAIRYTKIALVMFVALHALFYAVQNIANLDAAAQSVAYVMGNQEHLAYPSSFGPTITSPMLIWLALAIILLGEFSAGLIAARGAYDLWRFRNASATEFESAKRFGRLGCALSMVVWFGLFMVIGGAFFQMWQTEIGAASANGAFQIFTASALILLYLNSPDN